LSSSRSNSSALTPLSTNRPPQVSPRRGMHEDGRREDQRRGTPTAG
jgi:hypothetical protein